MKRRKRPPGEVNDHQRDCDAREKTLDGSKAKRITSLVARTIAIYRTPNEYKTKSSEPANQGAVLETPLGPVHVALEGAPRPGRPALLMLPDVGHTHASCFAPLFAHPEMREVASHFLLVHLDPPGMEVGAPPYPPGYQYPSLEQLAEIVPCVLRHLNIASIVGIGVGAGAFVLAKFGLLHPEAVEGLVLININPRAKGWVDWVAHKLSGLTSSSSELILAHLFTQEELAAAPPPVQQARRRLGAAPNAPLLWATYNS
ncbi:protein NDRG2-like [Chlamydotis macqueenii]